MATARPKISLKIRVLRDEKTAGDWGKLFDESVNVQLVIDWSMEKAAAQTQSRLEFQRVEACLSEEALERRGTELDAGDLSEMTVADLRDSFGRFLKVHCLTDAASSTPTQLPSAFDSMREAQRKSDQRDKERSVLPAPPTGDRFDFRLQRALILQLEAMGLGFSSVEVHTSGKDLIRLLALTLQYLLPFDVAEPSPLRADGRVHLKLPARFGFEVRPPSVEGAPHRRAVTPILPLAQALGEMASEQHHGAKLTGERLSAALLQTHAKKLTQFIGGPMWSESLAWQPFMADLCALTEGMEKLAAAMVRNNSLVKAAHERASSAHSPDCEVDLQGSCYKQCCSSGECHEKFEMLRGCVHNLYAHCHSRAACALLLLCNDCCSVHAGELTFTEQCDEIVIPLPSAPDA